MAQFSKLLIEYDLVRKTCIIMEGISTFFNPYNLFSFLETLCVKESIRTNWSEDFKICFQDALF
jgi:hypothetical protein